MFIESLLMVILILILILYYFSGLPPNMPPGPAGLPLIGYLPPRNRCLTHYLNKLKQKYGKLFTVKWGNKRIVFLADHQVIKRAFSHPDVQARPPQLTFQILTSFTNLGIINAHGLTWKNNRRFMIHHLRDMGMGKSRLEDSIAEEVEMLIKYLEKTSLDKPTQMDNGFNVAVINITWQMLASKRFEADDEEIIKYSKRITEIVKIAQGPIMLVDVFPWLWNVIPSFILKRLSGIDILEYLRDDFNSHCKNLVAEHLACLDPDSPRDIIDHHLIDMEADKTNPESSYRKDYFDLFIMIADMFAAASETTSTTLRWMILYMAINTEVQMKAQKILDEVVPCRDRLPSLQDRNKLNYIDALVLEVLRFSSHALIGAPHYTSAAVIIEGYTIPKDTAVISCLEVCHKDPDLWENPAEFYPEHFLDENGVLDSKKEAFMPFSVGRRQCLGESLARMNLFLFTAAILHRFSIQPPPGVQLSCEPDPLRIMFNYPQPFKVILKKRT